MTVEDLKYQLAAPAGTITITSGMMNKLLHRYMRMRQALLDIGHDCGPGDWCGYCELIAEMSREL